MPAVETEPIRNTTLFQRQPEFLELKEGGHIPGYRGHCPLLRYDYGKTFGQGTHEVYQARKGGWFDTSLGERSLTQGRIELTSERQARKSGWYDSPLGDRSLTQGRIDLTAERGPMVSTRKGQLRRLLPLSNGENKYTEDMVPGYTGYIPRYPFKFGDNYKEECDICLDEHFTNLQRRHGQHSESLRASRSLTSLTALNHDPAVKQHLNDYGTLLSGVSGTPRRGVYRPPVLDRDCELPITGYKGFIPRVNVTQIGLGTRYVEQTKNGLDAFYDEQARRAAMLRMVPREDRLSRDITIDRNPVFTNNAANWSSNSNNGTKPCEFDANKSSYLCERSEHTSRSHPNKAQKSVAFVI